MLPFPKIIQGGMGVGVSNWRLAQAVSRLGQLGVVSGTALDQVFVRRLADGDPGGHMRRGLDAFPFPEMARRIWQDYFVAGGKPPTAPYPTTPMHQRRSPRKIVELCIAANFVEVFLAREGHNHPIGINFLEKVQLPHLPSIYGAMLAGVGYVLMGAGIPLHIPAVLDAFAARRPAEYKLSVIGAAAPQPAGETSPAAEDTILRFDPADYAEGPLPALDRPRFLAIVSSNTLAITMLRRASGRVDGLIVEGHTAGGHNAPPRGKLQLTSSGEPVYGPRDHVDLAQLSELGVPIWMAGGYGHPEKLREALDHGATGIQVGTAFALSEESGLRPDLKHELLAQAARGQAEVFTDPLASPIGFPFKVARLPGTASDPQVYAERCRICDLGFLRELYVSPNGAVGSRCSAEPQACYVSKGGKLEDTTGRKCLCNALMANIGHAQVRKDGTIEPALVTVGDDLNAIARVFSPQGEPYTAAHVIHTLLNPGQIPAQQPNSPSQSLATSLS